jgi:2-polyprenyl-6-methoxyphenol hydroxylase-like FAD-dependent oxidoreductase
MNTPLGLRGLTKRRISIVGAGQFGLQLGIGLQMAGYDVTIVTNRSATQIRSGRVMSSQILFRRALEIEDELGLNAWTGLGGLAAGNHWSVTDGQGGKVFSLGRRVEGGLGQSVDQRITIPHWMAVFERAGGELLVAEAGIAELEELSADADLTIVAAGKGDVAGLFDRNDELCAYSSPQRHVAMFYVHGATLDEHGDDTLRFVQIPGVGEWVNFPALTHSGRCDILLFESQLGGEMHEVMGAAATGDEMIAAGLTILGRHAPWEAERLTDMQLTDDQAWLSGALTPTVRHPYAHLPSGRPVMGGGDVVIINDPIVGQGANNATKHADVVLKAILAHGDATFDEAFMQRTFDAHWEKAQWVCRFTNAMLNPPDHLVQVLLAMLSNTSILEEFQAGFADASLLSDWFFDEAAALQRIERDAASVTLPT